MFLSYAPNAEDVLLWRALQHIENGRYIDWSDDPATPGAYTQAFYDRGWSGLAIRPAAAAEALAAHRPRDTTLAEPPDHPVPGEVHFLRGDAASVAAVLAWRVRPWIAFVPSDDAAAAAALADAGYQFTLFDGVNRFYVAPEHAELAAQLAAPVNTADDFRRAADSDLPQRQAGLEAALHAAQLRADSSRAQLLDALRTAGRARADVGLMAEEATWLRSLIADTQDAEKRSRAESTWLRDQLDAARQATEERLKQLLARAEEVAWLRSCVADSDTRAAALDARLRDAERAAQATHAQLAQLESSTSWRVTRPLRRLRGHQESAPPALASPAQALSAPAPQPAPAAPVQPPSPQPVQAPPPPSPAATAPEPVPQPTAAPLPPRNPQPLTTVHQFHAGSAPHDAITNAMLLIRAQLRATGLRSEIYVENRGPGLEHDIRLLPTMPRHADYVLLLHHSMGHASFDEILGLPAPKVLIYHNITPPEFLAALPRIQRLAELGRQQLARLPHHVAFALADSAFNAVELHRLGFPATRACPLLFDVDALTRPPPRVRPNDGVFTVLFVGRVTPSKAQDALVDAFAAFRERFGRPCRLVLAGALDADEHEFIDTIAARIAAHGLEAHVHLLGLVPDVELDGWYHQADLYASLSRHEGFGVPLIEAAARGIPVVAWPTGAVPYTLAQSGTLLASRDPADVAAAMLDAARRPISAAPAALQRFALARQMPVLMGALQAAGALPPIDPAARRAVAANMRFAVTGHLTGSYSLAAVNRQLAFTLEATRPGSVRIPPPSGMGETHHPTPTTPANLPTLAARPRPDSGPELVISNHYPVHPPDEPADLAAALFFWEESLIPAETVATLNHAFDLVLAPSRFVARVLVDSGVSVPVINIGAAPALHPFADPSPTADAPRPFTFLHVSSAFPRKGVDVLLDAWAQAFTSADNVRLLIKTFPNPHNDAATQLAQLRRNHPDCAPITLVDEDLDPAAMLALYQDSDAAVLPTRGEGYNLPAAEAMAAGLPLLVTGYGGHLDFCTPTTARLLRNSLAPSRSHLAPPHSLWAEPDPADLAAALRQAASGQLAHLATPAREAIAAAADPAAFVARLADAAACVLLTAPALPLRMAWVTSWNVRCGVAEYARALLDALPRDGFAPPIVLADDRTAAEAKIHPSWRAGDASTVRRLADAVARADPDVLMIQHQPGLLPWHALAALIEATAEPQRVRVATLHNTLHLLDSPDAERTVVVAALATLDRVLVHTLADVNRLDRLGLGAVVTLLPHPAPPPATAPIRPLPPDAAPIIGCTGFFLPDKGIAQLIAAVARLRARWPAVRLRLVNAEYDDPASAATIAECRAAAAQAGLAVEWHTGFLPLAEQSALLRECDVIALPYQRSKEASSAALRSALGTGVPVAVTPLPLFDEAGSAVFRLPGTDPAPMELGLAHLLGSPERRSQVAADARDWLADRALPDVARRLAGIMRGLAAQRRLHAPRFEGIWQPAPDHADLSDNTP